MVYLVDASSMTRNEDGKLHAEVLKRTSGHFLIASLWLCEVCCHRGQALVENVLSQGTGYVLTLHRTQFSSIIDDCYAK